MAHFYKFAYWVRKCNSFVLQMAHFYNKKLIVKKSSPKYYQMIPKSL